MRTKSIRTKGKLQLSKYFQEFKEGDRVSVIIERSLDFNFPERLQGRTGIVEGKRGRICVVKIKDQDQHKKFLIDPIHLRRIGNEPLRKVPKDSSKPSR